MGPLNTYRSLEKTWELSAAWQHASLTVPALFITGTNDVAYHFPGMKEAIENMHTIAPNSNPPILLEGIGHWVQNEASKQVNEALINFLATI